MAGTTRRATAIVAALFAAGLAGNVFAQTPVKIGVIYPLSGNAASAGNYSKMASELGAEIVNNGNAELAKAGEVVEHNGVRIMGKLNLPGAVPVNASSLYARNLLAFIEPMVDKKTGALAVNWDDELVKGTLIAKDGAIVNAMIASEPVRPRYPRRSRAMAPRP